MSAEDKESETIQQNFRIIKAASWNRYHDWPPIGGLRYLIFNAKTNGFDKVIKRVGRSVLIDEGKFFEWVSDQNSLKAGGNDGA